MCDAVLCDAMWRNAIRNGFRPDSAWTTGRHFGAVIPVPYSDAVIPAWNFGALRGRRSRTVHEFSNGYPGGRTVGEEKPAAPGMMFRTKNSSALPGPHAWTGDGHRSAKANMTLPGTGGNLSSRTRKCLLHRMGNSEQSTDRKKAGEIHTANGEYPARESMERPGRYLRFSDNHLGRPSWSDSPPGPAAPSGHADARPETGRGSRGGTGTRRPGRAPAPPPRPHSAPCPPTHI